MSKEKNDKIKKPTQRKWHIFDASEESFGRMASKISILLRGKNKASYMPHIDGGDYVVVVNTDNLKYTGNKNEGKIYYSHSWYPGGLKQITLGDQIKKDSRMVIKKAVYGMLPKNKLRDQMIKRLIIYKNEDYLEKDKFK
ncbi:50S ribosomal protein L13 [Candidatus Parcubacteria bacterium]|nr:50S ribosomal protein L13 [Candidatus Parcubacteria bacterium]